jgi:hypothetical protein
MISIKELQLLEGNLSRRTLALVLEWANEHRRELIANWLSLQSTGDFAKVSPLE